MLDAGRRGDLVAVEKAWRDDPRYETRSSGSEYNEDNPRRLHLYETYRFTTVATLM